MIIEFIVAKGLCDTTGGRRKINQRGIIVFEIFIKNGLLFSYTILNS